MNKGLDLIKRQRPEIIDGFQTGNILIGVTKEELTELENELKALEIIAKEIGINAIIYGGFGYLLTDEQKDLLREVMYDLEDYNKLQKNDYSNLTEAEYDLLSEAL